MSWILSCCRFPGDALQNQIHQPQEGNAESRHQQEEYKILLSLGQAAANPLQPGEEHGVGKAADQGVI